jgi:hypothetical protein
LVADGKDEEKPCRGGAGAAGLIEGQKEEWSYGLKECLAIENKNGILLAKEWLESRTMSRPLRSPSRPQRVSGAT